MELIDAVFVVYWLDCQLRYKHCVNFYHPSRKYNNKEKYQLNIIYTKYSFV